MKIENFTLDCVCDECNAYFCKHLELALSRDSAEGFLRIRHGIKPPAASRDLLNRRIFVTIQEPGPYKGARAVFGPDALGESLEPIPVPQVAFRLPGEVEFRWILEGELTATAIQPFLGKGVEVRAVARSKDDLDRVVARIRELGIDFQQQGEFHEPVTNAQNTVAVETAFKVDRVIGRAIAKIAFNYAAKTLGAELVGHTDFDEARAFIRFDAEPVAQLIRVHRRPLLMDDPQSGQRQTEAHICCVGWAAATSIVASVSLFNELTYDVILCRRFTRVWRDFGYGHLFDPFERLITPLHRLRLVSPGTM